MQHEEEEPPKTISEVIIGLMFGSVAIGILLLLYLVVKILKLMVPS